MDIRTREAVRYLGYGKHAVDEHTLALIGEAFAQMEPLAGKKIIYRIFDMKIQETGGIDIEQLHIESRSLEKNLQGCRKVVLLGATLGTGIDRYIKRLGITDMAKAVVAQACAAVMLEEYLDRQTEEIAGTLQWEGLYLRPRFSPGYGDFDLKHQEMILRMLDAHKRIGLTMTEGSMLTPTKSVTALIGLGEDEIRCHRKGCEVCEKKDCMYRRDS